MRTRVLRAGLAATVTFWSADVAAQSTGTVTGSVRDAVSLAPLTGAQVSVEGARIGGLVDNDGRFRLPNVPEGARAIHVTMIGYHSDFKHVTVTAGAATTVDFSLFEEPLQLSFPEGLEPSAPREWLDTQPTWSPDGTKIAFVSGRDGGEVGIYVMDADGSNPLELASGADYDSDPVWSPDGAKIAFVADNNIYVVDADGSAQLELASDVAHDSDPAWSPDGTKIAFSTHRGFDREIYVVDADGSNRIYLASDLLARTRARVDSIRSLAHPLHAGVDDELLARAYDPALEPTVPVWASVVANRDSGVFFLLTSACWRVYIYSGDIAFYRTIDEAMDEGLRGSMHCDVITPPGAPAPVRGPTSVAATLDDAWDAAVEHFAESRIRIATLVESSGFIATRAVPADLDSAAEFVDCGTVGHRAQPPSSVVYHVIVRGTSTSTSSVQATAHWSPSPCVTRGVWEARTESEIKARTER